jgi:hypothetical protein
MARSALMSWETMNPGALPQSADECCAFGATDTQLSSLLRLKLTWTGSTLGLE